MQRSVLGKDLVVSAVGLGCMGMTFGYGSVGREQALATVERALERGVTFFDTSDHYGSGTNETLIGEALAGRWDEVQIATKFGSMPVLESGRVPDGRPEQVRLAVEGSLRRLGVDTIDLYYLHRVDPRVPIEETVGAMAQLVLEGKVRHLGLSEASPATIRRAHAVHPITAVQSEYSLWSRDVEHEVLPTLRDLGVGFVPYSPLGRGFLTGAIASVEQLDTDDFRRVSPRFQGENFARNRQLLRPLRTLARTVDATPAQVALAWVMRMCPGAVPIPGTTRPERIDENVEALAVQLEDEHLADLDIAFPPGAPAGTRWPEQMMEFLNG
ncbi:aldo/keto reductase [Kribbella sp. VKM Ac-2566]|uniref:aldo/keto reductase n=1 Tax=Kribbella sp. VKM Ac-2566 TaxID=2512218 RepID=UPI0010634114|nr:aldo/keto reductase [Kribbella sp. VKM Ac-2566]TDW79553.1 aryl-alcohol dehydrogenase-like predicted oxidoreductase [Kribbella sp. VKM Ac-2566]